MTQYSAWFNDKTYNAVDDRYGMISLLWDGVGAVAPVDSVHAQPGVIPTVGMDGMRVVQHAAGANMSVDVSPGQVLISKTGDIRGTYMGVNDAVKNLTVSAADVSNPRIDSVFATITDQDYGDSTSGFTTVIVTGTPALSPVAPTAPVGVAYYLRLADIAVAANVTSITTANITGKRVFATPTGSTGRTTVSPPANLTGNGTHWYNPSTDQLEWSMNGHTTILGPPGGYGWNSFTPTLTASTTNPTLGTGSSAVGEWRYLDNGDWIIYQGKITFGTSGVGAGSGTYRISLPKTTGTFGTPPIHGKALLLDNSATASMHADMLCGSPSVNFFNVYMTQSASGGANFATESFPWTWAANDSLTWSIIYPVSSVI